VDRLVMKMCNLVDWHIGGDGSAQLRAGSHRLGAI